MAPLSPALSTLARRLEAVFRLDGADLVGWIPGADADAVVTLRAARIGNGRLRVVAEARVALVRGASSRPRWCRYGPASDYVVRIHGRTDYAEAGAALAGWLLEAAPPLVRWLDARAGQAIDEDLVGEDSIAGQGPRGELPASLRVLL